MFNKLLLNFLLIASCTLQVLSSGDCPSSVTTIPFTKQTSLTGVDGVFDAFKVLRSLIDTQSKHRQNLINLEQNLGKGALPEGGEIPSLDSLIDLYISLFGGKEGSEPLTDVGDVLWSGFITVGIPPQNFSIDFDTGSSDLWVFSSACVTPGSCNNKRKYDASTSITSQHKPGNFHIQYGTGAINTGDIVTDTVDVAGIKVWNQYLAAATNASSFFDHFQPDGLLGLAFPELSNLKHDPFFHTAIKQKAVSSPVFAFYLTNTSDSELHLGGVNHCLFIDPIEAHPLLEPGRGFWQIPDGRVDVNGNQKVVSGFDAIIDSGTTLMYGPPDAVKEVYAQVPGSMPYPQIPGFYQFPCNAIPKVSFGFGGRQWEVSAGNFNLGLASEGSTYCVGSLVGQDFGLGKNTWLLGDSFMKNVYTVFDVGHRAVGFAELAKK